MTKGKRPAPQKQSPSRHARPTIGLLIKNTIASWELLQWQGMVDEARERDVNLICFPGRSLRQSDGFHAQANVLYELNAEKIDGLIICTGTLGQYVSREELEEFCKRPQPLPVVGFERAIGGIPTVFQGDYQSMHEAIAHLIEAHGCRHIAFIGGSLGHLGHQERYRAYVDTLAEYGLSLDPKLVYPPTVSDDSAAVTRWLLAKRKTDINAVVGASDVLALLAMQTLRAQEMRIPEDVAVVGFDNIAEARAVMPPLTTIRPAFYEMGQKAVETVLALIAGEQVPEQVILPGRLVVRESCGCSLAPVLQATVEEVTASGETLDAALAGHRERILSAMTAMVGIPIAGLKPQWAARLLDGLVADLIDSSNRQTPAEPHKATPGAFVRALDEILHQVADAGGDLGAWQGVLSELRRHTLPCLVGDARTLYRADDLWGQARVLIGERAQRMQAFQVLQAEKRSTVLREIGRELLAIIDVEALTDSLARGLPRLGIPSCYLSLYEDPQPYEYPKPAPKWSRLILAYTEQGRMKLESGGRSFPSRQLVPEGLWPQGRRYTYMVEALFFQEVQLGFVLFEVGPREGEIYDALRGELSSVLYSTKLVQQVESHTRELQQAYETLQKQQQALLITEKMASLGRLTAGIAHEMNTPLAAVRATLVTMEALVKEYETSIDDKSVSEIDHHEIARELHSAVQLADKAAERAAGFVRGIKSQTLGLSTQEQHPINAVVAVEDALLLLSHALRQGKCELDFKKSDEEIFLEGMPGRLEQVVTNLVNNSIDASYPQGGPIAISLNKLADFVELQVRDRGSGILPENLSKIFDPMFSTKPFGSSTGLGLTIVHDIVVGEFGGSISVDSQQGQGTTFTIRFPRNK
jgi:DNA-binding LacI/PurR family transcriptional regulator/signal transduction histidine kinase